MADAASLKPDPLSGQKLLGNNISPFLLELHHLVSEAHT